MHQLTGDFYTVGEVLGHTLAGIGASLGLSMNFEAVTARYVDVRLERKKEVLDAYHSAVEKAAPEKPKEAEPKKGKRAAKKKHSEIDLYPLYLFTALYNLLYARVEFGHHLGTIYGKSTMKTEGKRNADNSQKRSVHAGFRRFPIP